MKLVMLETVVHSISKRNMFRMVHAELSEREFFIQFFSKNESKFFWARKSIPKLNLQTARSNLL